MFREYLNHHDLKALLLAPGGFAPFPRRQERARWEALGEETRREIITWGDEAFGGYPMVTATQFLAFSRTGDRQVFEQPYFARRHLLMGAVLAECLLDDGAHMDAVIDGLWCIMEETSWVLSAHNGSDHPGALPMTKRPLPDEGNPYVDLFAAQTAATLAYTLYFMEDKLDEVSPLIARRVRAQLERRVITPFMTHDDFWWMGMIRRDVCNWTPWILSNILTVALLTQRDAIRLAQIVERALRMLDSYLAVMPADGGCDEGAAYFNVAGAALLDCLEAVYEATGGRVSFYDDPLIVNIGAFPLHAHIDGAYYLNFADCDAMPALDGARIWRYGQRTGNAELCSLGAHIHAGRRSVRPLDTPQMNRVLHALFDPIPVAEEPAPERFVALPDLQVFAWRRGGMYAAVKGGHNAENHNHNDVGSFVVFADGEPQIVDMGNMVYTARTFGPERYTLVNTRSRNHNVPLIGGTEQAAGRERAARDVSGDARGARMDIAAAYPPEAGVRSLVRELGVQDGGFALCDCVELAWAQEVTWVFMLRERPETLAGEVRAGKIALRHDPALVPRVEEMPVTDERLRRNFPGSLFRLTLTAAPGACHRQSFIITRS